MLKPKPTIKKAVPTPVAGPQRLHLSDLRRAVVERRRFASGGYDRVGGTRRNKAHTVSEMKKGSELETVELPRALLESLDEVIAHSAYDEEQNYLVNPQQRNHIWLHLKRLIDWREKQAQADGRR
jgi:hypothetical protein